MAPSNCWPSHASTSRTQVLPWMPTEDSIQLVPSVPARWPPASSLKTSKPRRKSSNFGAPKFDATCLAPAKMSCAGAPLGATSKGGGVGNRGNLDLDPQKRMVKKDPRSKVPKNHNIGCCPSMFVSSRSSLCGTLQIPTYAIQRNKRAFIQNDGRPLPLSVFFSVAGDRCASSAPRSRARRGCCGPRAWCRPPWGF